MYFVINIYKQFSSCGDFFFNGNIMTETSQLLRRHIHRSSHRVLSLILAAAAGLAFDALPPEGLDTSSKFRWELQTGRVTCRWRQRQKTRLDTSTFWTSDGECSTHHCCHSRHRRPVLQASCRDSAPWFPNRSCRWGWAQPPASQGERGKRSRRTGV